MEVIEESDHNVLLEIANDEELTQIPRELVRKINVHFNNRFEEFITAKAVFETNRKCLGKLDAGLKVILPNISGTCFYISIPETSIFLFVFFQI